MAIIFTACLFLMLTTAQAFNPMLPWQHSDKASSDSSIDFNDTTTEVTVAEGSKALPSNRDVRQDSAAKIPLIDEFKPAKSNIILGLNHLGILAHPIKPSSLKKASATHVDFIAYKKRRENLPNVVPQRKFPQTFSMPDRDQYSKPNRGKVTIVNVGHGENVAIINDGFPGDVAIYNGKGPQQSLAGRRFYRPENYGNLGGSRWDWGARRAGQSQWRNKDSYEWEK